MRFKGKTAVWFYAVILLVAAVCIPILIAGIRDAQPAAILISLSVLVLTEAFCLSIAVCNYVELQEESLQIVFGFIWKRIPFREITALSATRDPSSSLAASLDRIRIQTKSKGSVMISVTDKAGLLQAVQSRNPGIAVR